MTGIDSVRSGSRVLAILGTLMLLATPSLAERRWVKDELVLNLRSGPGNEFRILGVIKTGDEIDVLERASEWTQVEVDRFGRGWIPNGYLQTDPPARHLLPQREVETAELREEIERLTSESEELHSANRRLAERDQSRNQKIERLVRENLELRVGPRWPEWIAGASILGVGMILGSILQKNSARSKSPRLRL